MSTIVQCFLCLFAHRWKWFFLNASPVIFSTSLCHTCVCSLPKDQDCHELWSKRRKRTQREQEKKANSGSDHRGSENSLDQPGTATGNVATATGCDDRKDTPDTLGDPSTNDSLNKWTVASESKCFFLSCLDWCQLVVPVGETCVDLSSSLYLCLYMLFCVDLVWGQGLKIFNISFVYFRLANWGGQSRPIGVDRQCSDHWEHSPYHYGAGDSRRSVNRSQYFLRRCQHTTWSPQVS